jgi:hypothetical protein
LGAGQSEKIKRMRIIGIPIEYYVVNNIKKDPDAKEGKKVPFPDADVNPMVTRVCDDDPAKCIWTQMGYSRQKKYAVNVIDRETSEVKILAKGPAIFNPIAEKESNNKAENIENGDDSLWEMAGGADAADMKIKVIADSGAFGGVKYQVNFTNRTSPITEDEIEVLRSIHEPTAEEIEAIRDSNDMLQDTEKYPDWMFYGFDLDKYFAPTPLSTRSNNKPVEEIDEDEISLKPSDDDEDDDEDPPVKKTSKAKKVADDEEDDDEEDPPVKKTSKTKKVVDDEEDDEDPPVKKTSKAKKVADDEEDENMPDMW